MKVALIGLNEEFNNIGSSGIRRQMHELYSNISDIKGIKIDKIDISIPKTKSFSLTNFYFLQKTLFLDFGDYDIVHHINSKPIISLNKKKAKLLSTVYELPELMNYENLNKVLLTTRNEKIVNLIQKFSYKTILNSSDYIIAISHQTKYEAISLGYPKDRVFVVYLGVDDRFRTQKKPKESSKQFIVGYLGELRKRKNVKFAITAFKHINDLNTKLMIYGNKTEEYENLVKLSKNDKRIKFMGFAPENKLVEVYDSFDVAVHTTLYTGFELEILEEQARGLPVIVPKSSMIPKEVKKYCFEAKDEMDMAEIITNIKENGYNEIKQRKAMEYARSFTWEKCAQETFKVYQKILGGW